jgi:beta-fructofuranosidase
MMQANNTSTLAHPNPAIERAMQSVMAAMPRTAADPQRPRYHFGPPANWMNDPNGTIYANGYYHLFYQHNPYGDEWGHMHWSHARSRDLVHWEHLPIALWPSLEMGEEHVFSGCASITADGTPILFYTSVGHGRQPQPSANEQWAALGDGDWITWQKHPANPILSLATHGGPAFEPDWRDPFIFHAKGRTFLVLGGSFDDTAAVALYEATDGTLTRWHYRSLLHTTSRADFPLSECPNFFPVSNEAGGTDWVLLTSPYHPVTYEVGDFDLETLTFTAATQGTLDAGNTPRVSNAHYYATNIINAPDGRVILFGWVRGFPAGHGWNGCLALPRVLTIGPDRRPRQNPVAELKALRGRELTFAAQTLPPWTTIVATAAEARLEIDTSLRIAPGQSMALYVRAQNSSDPSLALTYDGAMLTMGETAVPLTLEAGEPLRLHLFIDHSVCELYVNDGCVAITLVQPMPTTLMDIEIDPQRSNLELLAFTAWELSPI